MPASRISCCGGGGAVDGTSSVETFADAAERVAAHTGMPCVLLVGPLYAAPDPQRRGVVARRATPSQTIDLMADAELVVLGAGSSLYHALALRKVCVATGAGGTDQLVRAATCAARGLVAFALPDAGSVADAARALLADPTVRAVMRRRVVDFGVTNDVPQALSAMRQLLTSNVAVMA
ncbi:MAG: hypothetical protein ABI629_26615 [bacterium]